MTARLVLSLALLGAAPACRNVDVCDAACKDAHGVPDSYPSLVVHSTEVVIYVSNNGVAYMQRFGKNGASLIKSGLPRDAQVRAVDYKYVWYTAWADPITRRLLRAEWYTFDF